MPEFMLVKLKSDFKSHASRGQKTLNSYTAMHILSTFYAKFQILDKQKCEYFFPYPMVSKPYRYIRSNVDLKNMYLVNLKFLFDNVLLNEKIPNKRLFYLFVQQLFIRPTNALKHSCLKNVCRNVDVVCRDTSINPYLPIRHLDPYKILKLFQYLYNNKEISLLRNLEKHVNHGNALSNDRRIKLKSLRDANKEFSGKFKFNNRNMDHKITTNRAQHSTSPEIITDIDIKSIQNDAALIDEHLENGDTINDNQLTYNDDKYLIKNNKLPLIC